MHSKRRSSAVTALGNITGQPAISLPLGMDQSGLPDGCSLWGRSGAENHCCRLAAAARRIPPLAGTPSRYPCRGRSIGMAIARAYWLRFDRHASLSCWSPNCRSGPRLIRRNTYRWMNLSAAALCGSCGGLRIRKFSLTDHQELQTGLTLCMNVPYVMCCRRTHTVSPNLAPRRKAG